MRKRILEYVRRTFGQNYFEPDPEVHRFVVSYPRSGNTWLRAVLFDAYIGSPPASLEEIDYGIPDIHYPIKNSARLKPCGADHGPAIVKSHEPRLSGAKYNNAVYIVRDPRDVIPSYYRFLAKKMRGQAPEFRRFVRASLLGQIWPCSWYEHVTSWAHQGPDQSKVVFVRYEDLTARDVSAIELLQNGLRLNSDLDVRALLERYDLQMMRHLEEAGQRPTEMFGHRQPFIGRGVAKSEERNIVVDEIDHVAPHFRDRMTDFGYE